MFINFLLIIMCILILVIIHKIDKNLYNPMFILFVQWLFILILCFINIYQYKITIEAFFIIFLGLIGSIVSFLFMAYLKKFKPTYSKKILNVKLSNKRYNVLFIFLIVAIFVVFLLSLNVIQMILSGVDYAIIRYTYLEDILQNPILNLLLSYFAKPLALFMIPVSLVLFQSDIKSKKNIVLLILSIILVLMISFVLGERFIVMDLALGFLLSFLIMKQNFSSKVYKKVKKKLYIILCLFIIVFFSITSARGTDAFKTIYTYSSGCLPHMSIKLETVNNFTYGFTSLNGVFRPFFQLIDENNQQFIAGEEALENIEKATIIGEDIRFNGFISIFYYFYVDFGYVGVFLFSLILGIIMSNIYINMSKTMNSYLIIKYCLFMFLYLSSYFQFLLSVLNLPIALLMYYLLFQKKRIKFIY